MKNYIDYLSKGTYLYLPTKNNPRVILNISDNIITKNSFKLYNPFSFRAKFLKKTTYYLSLYTKKILSVLIIKNRQTSDIIIHFEKKYNCSIDTSVYFATAKDKVVLQLQNMNGVLGYAKIPINKVGESHLDNEKRGIELLSQLGLCKPFLEYGYFHNYKYLLLKEIDGQVQNHIEHSKLLHLLKHLEIGTSFKLRQHPRVISLIKELEAINYHDYINIINKICSDSNWSYKYVYEHGDFAPWNIINTENELCLFDFEFFTEDGIEYFDLIKYYYQIGSLLKRLSKLELYNYIKEYCIFNDFESIFKLYLIKEILNLSKEQKPYSNEDALLKLLINETI